MEPRPQGRAARAAGDLTAMRVAILSARQGWHTDQLCRALAERGHEGRVVPYEALAAHLGGAAAGVAAGAGEIGACGAGLAGIIPAGPPGQSGFRVDVLTTREERGL